MNFHSVINNAGQLWSGLLITLELSALTITISIFTGFVVALLSISPYRVVRLPIRAYIEIFRCTPALVQVVWFFYCVPVLFNVFWEPFTMGVIVFSLNLTAYNAEAYRAAIQAVPSAHSDAAVALGLKRTQYYRFVVFPQSLRLAVPVLLTNSIGMIQQSALVALVAVNDLMYESKQLASQTYRPIEVFTVAAGIYFLISLVMSRAVEFVGRRTSRLIDAK
ncbi:amino acid ABC transporter permease [Pseudomonas gingeri]|uniref:Amino acid ABC transporter permease n=1 Tax=Pseudomonas gingeri TaxID=117681 RepID=A0A7Y7YFZ1_9PSED|nr:amino acid ABC transporter permease [Pseudomonas gingeri]NWB31427.1 amino acid ABC transporter permease [Pseudomonas gingeri]NWC35708.1 amino acid ABC transporter permease [Pseudomonas gingeri]NWD49441.1 amino acid ABC transporter permease [Pseudomonas gingeri]NWE26449.1 amino acid ABC transporter permease [Pseudomonas gingeri]NWE97422.1 amino acid ABC transporter permease [Pseudomonas gingeri]